MSSYWARPAGVVGSSAQCSSLSLPCPLDVLCTPPTDYCLRATKNAHFVLWPSFGLSIISCAAAANSSGLQIFTTNPRGRVSTVAPQSQLHRSIADDWTVMVTMRDPMTFMNGSISRTTGITYAQQARSKLGSVLRWEDLLIHTPLQQDTFTARQRGPITTPAHAC